RAATGGAASAPAAALAAGVLQGPGLMRGVIALVIVSALGLAVAAAVGALRGPGEPRAALATPSGSAKTAVPQQRTDREGVPLPAEAVARIGSTRLRHGWLPRNLDYSPDGKLLASYGWNRLRIWDAASGKLVRHIPLSGGPHP